jgi:thiamine-phosphate pyrophosphorylase
MPIALVRKLLGPRAIVGLSITSSAVARSENVTLADYLGVGPIFAQ